MIGTGTVGRWLLEVLSTRADDLERRYDIAPVVVGVANARDGFVYSDDGLHIPTLLENLADGRPLSHHPDVHCWPSAVDGLRATDADLLVEVTASPADTDGEPGLSHMREALSRGIGVATSNKWPVALHGVELFDTARRNRTVFRAESTVMSGTPTLSTLTDGIAGARPWRLRGVLNAVANFMLTRMEGGDSYGDAFAAAQDAGLAERDPTADVEGLDAAAKAMILAALAFGTQLRREDVRRRGIAGVDREQVAEARAQGFRIKEVVTVERSGVAPDASVTARVEPMPVPPDDPLARVDGTDNILTCAAEPVGEISITGPGAGPRLAGQGVFSDIIAATR